MMTNDQISNKLGLMLLAKGRALPDFLATLSMPDRMACVRSIDAVHKLPEELFIALLAWPARMPRTMTRETMELLDRLAVNAKKVTSDWSFPELATDLRKIAATRERWNLLSMQGGRKAILN